ncbi:hypothetical protein N7539_004164 [Penicillium diatomitis]|uniref:Uncharacterized protein n=1 Tax=Penicillium diatomitis TaxID=2819901 RepID=A0A9W9XDH0_9EURO|nr:uncharacterized protein N7539_004164 [Penicillium diatomitis]KAJ5489274.1 hypothetical protein N7539_004164 [Penicillium diatomitis]
MAMEPSETQILIFGGQQQKTGAIQRPTGCCAAGDHSLHEAENGRNWIASTLRNGDGGKTPHLSEARGP